MALNEAASMPADVRELSTTPTPAPWVKAAQVCANEVPREHAVSRTWRVRASMRFLALPAVAYT
eukprot:7101652-Pyramimonas_sp.AAC.1